MKRKILISSAQYRCSVHELRVLENLLSRKLLFALIASIVIFLFSMHPAWAQYPVEPPEVKPRYAWTEWTGTDWAFHRVGSHLEACIEQMNYQNSKTSSPEYKYSNPRTVPIQPNGSVDVDYPLAYRLDCLYAVPLQPNYPVTAGLAVCGDSFKYPYGARWLTVSVATMKCVCPPGAKWFDDAQECVGVLEVTEDVPDIGDCNCRDVGRPNFGEPIDPGTGNMSHVEKDFVASAPGQLELSRVYNSSLLRPDSHRVNLFGANWTTEYDASLRQEGPLESATGPRAAICWQREDTKFTWCELRQNSTYNGSPTSVSILRGSGKRTYFSLVNGAWVGEVDNNDHIAAEYNSTRTAITGWIYMSSQGDRTERYDVNGKLLAITSRAGVTRKLTYSNGGSNDTTTSRWPVDAPVCSHRQQNEVLPPGRLLCVTDQWGRQIQFEYDSIGRVVKMFDPIGQTYSYEYDGSSGGCDVPDPANPSCSANNLTKMTYPDGKARTYLYYERQYIGDAGSCFSNLPSGGPNAFLNLWTGLIDENGQRYISWTYDCLGRATSSKLGDGANKITVDYSSDAGPTVTKYVGDPDTPTVNEIALQYGKIVHSAKNTFASAPCDECGPFTSKLYDDNGNLTETTDWRGYRNYFEYDPDRNLQTLRVDADGTANARQTRTEWHPQFRLPVRVAEPKRITINAYDVKGNVLSKKVQATNDSDGSSGFDAVLTGPARAWSYTYNGLGQVTTVTNPNNSVTRYAYDARGNLATITDSANHVTTLSNYDANGRVGHVLASNGLTTDIVYNSRGGIISQTISDGSSSETTAFAYDGVGQLTKVTFADGTDLTFSYDAAHRLTKVADSAGNSVVYTLDNVGNRTGEQTIGRDGVLTRKINRVFDSLNNLTQINGASQ